MAGQFQHLFDLPGAAEAHSALGLKCADGCPVSKFNIYDDIRSKLINMGVPQEEIAFIHSAKQRRQRKSIFEKVRNGDVRILIGSTSKMGAGTNVQNKLIASHDLDCPWKPRDMEQRRGRMVRQGNENQKGAALQICN